MSNYTYGRTFRERLLSRLEIDPETGCLNWTGPVNSNGYGWINRDGHIIGVYRAMYEMFAGPVPDGMELDHLCRNTRCASVDHLEPVTHRENILRATGPVAERAKQNQCIRGHEFDLFNTYWRPNGTRACKSCRPLRLAARRAATA